MSLDPAHRAVVEHTERLLAALRAAVRDAAERPGHRALPDLRAPCFAHLRVSTGGRQRDLLLGYVTLIDTDHRVTLIDWRSAPLAAVFFNYEVGETYEEDLGPELKDRVITGRVEQKHLLAFHDGELVRIGAPDATLVRRAGDDWQIEPAETAPRLTGGETPLTGTDRSRRRIPVVTDLLDPQQRATLERDDRRPLLILGGAGCGKTTVALHRLAHLHRLDPKRYSQRRMVVVVPEAGLARLSAAMLEELGLDTIGVFTFDQWISREARRVFRDLPRRECLDPPARVVAFKRHPALLAVLPQLIERRTAAMARRLDRSLAGLGAVEQRLLATPGPTPLARLDRCQAELLATSPSHLHAGIRKACAEERSLLHQAREDLLHLFGDRELLERAAELGSSRRSAALRGEAAELAAGELTPSAVNDVLEHTRLQFSETAEQAFAHVDPDQRRTLDGRSLDDGTPQEAAQTVDIEDYAVCFELLRLKTGGLATRHGRLARYAHVVIDEAQDLAPVELAVLGRALRPGASVTISGDRSQQIDPNVCFTDWERALDDLGVERSQPVHLRTSYRCPEPITAFAHQLLGPLAPAEMPHAHRPGLPVLRACYPSEAHVLYAMTRALADLLEREPAATVAVIASDPESARRIHQLLDRSLPVRHVRAGEFTFTPGIDVTDVAQVKGLEFDVVVVPDATPARYPDEPGARRRLHVAATRAICQLWVASVGRPSPILPPTA